MNRAARSSVWLVLAMLLGAALTGRTVLDSELPAWTMLGLAILAAAGCRGLRGGGKVRQAVVAKIWSLAIGSAIAGFAIWYGGRTQVSTWWTGAAFGILGWVWCRALLVRGAELEALPRMLALVAASIIVCQVAGDALIDYPANCRSHEPTKRHRRQPKNRAPDRATNCGPCRRKKYRRHQSSPPGN